MAAALNSTDAVPLACAAWLHANGRGAHVPFLQACWDDWLNPVPRLVYADWLDEQSESLRARLLRIGCALERLEWTEADQFEQDEYRRLSNEDALLCAAHRQRTGEKLAFWDGLQTHFLVDEDGADDQLLHIFHQYPINRLGLWLPHSSRSGIHTHINLVLPQVRNLLLLGNFRQEQDCLQHAEEILRLPWRNLIRLDLWSTLATLQHSIAVVAQQTWLRGMRRFNLMREQFSLSGTYQNQMDEVQANSLVLTPLLQSPYLHRIERLDWEHTQPTDESWRQLANDAAQHLHTLALRYAWVSAAAGHALADGQRWPRLATLSLNRCRIDSGWWDHLGTTAAPPPIRKLLVTDCGVQDAQVVRLAEGKCLDGLTELSLNQNQLGVAACTALARHRDTAQWQKLHLAGNRLPVAAMRALCGGQWKLTHLDLSNCGLGQESIRLLTQSSSFPHLTHLSLANNSCFSETAARLITQAKWLRQLQYLDLSVNQVANNNLAIMFYRHLLPELHTLILRSNFLSDRRYPLLQTVQLPNLHTLDLSFNSLKNGGLTALSALELPRLRRLQLSNGNIANAGLRTFVRSTLFRQLDWLDLRNNHIGNEGAHLLAEYLPSSPRLFVDLRDKRLGPKSRAILASCPQILFMS